MPPARAHVCVTGFSCLEEVDAFRAVTRELELPQAHALTAGVLVCNATLRGEAPPLIGSILRRWQSTSGAPQRRAES